MAPDYPVTAESIARAKAQAQTERDTLNADIYPRTGWFVYPDGRLRHVAAMNPVSQAVQ